MNVARVVFLWVIISVEFLDSGSVNGDHELFFESHCVASNWHLFTLIYKSSLPVIPCNINYLRVVYDDYGEDDDERTFKVTSDIGVLGSFDNLTYWAMKEENIMELVTEKRNQLLEELKLVNELEFLLSLKFT